MAGLSTKAIKTRIKSMASTRQITKAMELVASSKLRSAQSRAVACRPYFTALYEAMNEIADSSRSFESPYLRQAGPGKTIYIVIAGDRGLAGGYNNNVLKLAFRQMPQDAVVLPIGKKTVEFSSTAAARSSPRSIARRRPSPLATVIALQSSSQTGFWTRRIKTSFWSTRISSRSSRRRPPRCRCCR